MISGKLPNNTVWWLSKDGSKIWIESKDLELDKFKEKGYNIDHDVIFYSKKDVGELTISRLESRKCEDAWVVKLQAMIDVYPELIDDIQRKEIEDRKKKKTRNVHKNKNKKSVPKASAPMMDIIEKDFRKESYAEHNKPRAKVIDCFDVNRQYVTWIKNEIDKNGGSTTMPTKSLKEKMGEEFLNMHDFRIYFGLKKILSSIGIDVELGSTKGESVLIVNYRQ